MSDIAIIGSLLLGSGGLLTGVMALLSLRSQNRNIDSQTGLNKAQETEVINRAAQINEERERKREEAWQEKIDRLEKQHGEEINTLKRELVTLQLYVDEVIPWIWGAVRHIRLNGIEYPSPPSLPEIRRKMQEL